MPVSSASICGRASSYRAEIRSASVPRELVALKDRIRCSVRSNAAAVGLERSRCGRSPAMEPCGRR